jgi:acetolactate synthase small subunit
MLASRGYNIDSLAVGETENKNLSRMTFVVVGDNHVLEQVRKQLEKIVTVVEVQDISSRDYVERDLMLISLTRSNDRGEIGFLSDKRRLNVALTRARRKLIVVGDSSTLAQHAFFDSLLRYVEEKGSYKSVWEFL